MLNIKNHTLKLGTSIGCKLTNWEGNWLNLSKITLEGQFGKDNKFKYRIELPVFTKDILIGKKNDTVKLLKYICKSLSFESFIKKAKLNIYALGPDPCNLLIGGMFRDACTQVEDKSVNNNSNEEEKFKDIVINIVKDKYFGICYGNSLKVLAAIKNLSISLWFIGEFLSKTAYKCWLFAGINSNIIKIKADTEIVIGLSHGSFSSIFRINSKLQLSLTAAISVIRSLKTFFYGSFLSSTAFRKIMDTVSRWIEVIIFLEVPSNKIVITLVLANSVRVSAGVGTDHSKIVFGNEIRI